MSINSVAIAGYIGREPEIKYFENGKSKVGFSVGINKVKNGEESVTWVSVEAWDKVANFISKYLHSGSFIVVQGRLDSSHWEDQDGNKKSRLFVVAERVESPKSLSNNNSNLNGANANKEAIPF